MEPLVNILTCKLKTDKHSHRHFLDEPRILPCCQERACNKCILRSLSQRQPLFPQSDMEFHCPLCKKVSKISISNANECKLELDDSADKEFNRYAYDLNHYLVDKLDSAIKHVQGRFLIYCIFSNLFFSPNIKNSHYKN
jgi:hypothetical protein